MMKTFEEIITREDFKKPNKFYEVCDFILDVKEKREERCSPRLEDQVEAYLYMDLAYGIKELGLTNSSTINRYFYQFIYSLKELELLHPSSINMYIRYLETGKERIFLEDIKENLCYLIAKELFPEEPVKRTVEFYNSYQRIGKAVINYYKNLKEELKKPETIKSKTTLLSKLGVNFPLLTAEQRRAIESVLTDISIEELFHGYIPLNIELDKSQIRFNKKTNEKYLFRAAKYHKACEFDKANEEYEKLLKTEPQLTLLIKKFTHFNKHFSKKADETLKKYDKKLERIVKQKKSLVGIVQDLRKDDGHFYLLKGPFRIQGKLVEMKISYLFKVLENAIIDSKHEEDFFFIDSIHFELATNYQSLGDDRTALGYLKKISSEDLLPYTYWMIASTYEDLKEHEEAVKYWRKLSEIVPKDFEIIHNKTNEVGRIKSPFLKNVIFKQNIKKEKPKREFENTNFIFNEIKDRIFNSPVPIVYIENQEGKSYALFKEVKPSVGKALTLQEELDHCRKQLRKVSEMAKKEHPWFNEKEVLREYKRLMIKSVIDQLVDMQTGIKPEKIKKHIPEFSDYDYEKILEEKLTKRINMPEILEYSKPLIAYLGKQKRVFGHCDLHAGNIIDKGIDNIVFVDFEHSALTNQLFDLAFFLERPCFNFDEEEKKGMINYFISNLEEKGEKVENPYKSYLYNAAFVNMRIIAGCRSWAKRTGKKYAKDISFHKKSAIKAIDKIIEKYEKDAETLSKLKKSLKELKINYEQPQILY